MHHYTQKAKPGKQEFRPGNAEPQLGSLSLGATVIAHSRCPTGAHAQKGMKLFGLAGV